MTSEPRNFPRDFSAEMVTLNARVLAEDGPQPDATLMPSAEGRAMVERNNLRWNRELPALARRETVTLDADESIGSARRKLEVLVPDNALPGALIFVHGGGFCFCSTTTHERCARLLAVGSGLPVLMPDYRLAPEDPFPAGLNDVVAAMRNAFSATDHLGVTRGPLLISGDSAGANLALAAMLHEQQAGQPDLAGALLFYGTYDCDFNTPSYLEFAEGFGLTRAKMQRYWAAYSGGGNETTLAATVLASPLKASDEALSRLPPLHLMAAGVDPLLSDTLRLEARLKALERSETTTVYPGVTHGFLQNSIDLETAREALKIAGGEARRMAAAA
ncbi:alpha/beta hydrolase [Pararhizobium antarcticum]|uniref:Alpha/beta hydrolase n=1 Tax=Pararhizobium antarcticum TaxID=1798805 RepID=A0A657LWL0_9HYPH|nr:alpha/beta hydrolase [Pararhizobium antarcticum]OJF98208.1 alpha/beta hydrolase [Rhizobium sp. 58]OJF99200.1 alpha/beta hydrolase [Pararhizobium antarcticum]